MGVRGIALEDGDKVISLSILRHVEVTRPGARPYLKRCRGTASWRGTNGDAHHSQGRADARGGYDRAWRAPLPVGYLSAA